MNTARHVIDTRTRLSAEDEFKRCTQRVERAQVNHPIQCGYFGPRDDAKLAPSAVSWRLY
jgi:hypothetical protein